MPEETTLARKRGVMYALGLLFSLSCAIPTYVNSTFLSQFVGEGLVGIVYTLSSLIAIAAFLEMPDVIRRFGAWKTALGLLSLELLSLAGLVFGNGVLAVAAAFILNFVTISITNFVIDLFLERLSPNTQTGKIRGTYLTFCNIAWFASPIISAQILDVGSFPAIYAASAVLLLPVLALIFGSLHLTQEPLPARTPFWKSFGEVWTDRNIKGILVLQFLLQFFYAWMIIYTPLYLSEVVGFEWDTIGVIFTVMLLPFLLLEAPLGRLADRAGEKRLLGVGFAIMGVSTVLIAFVTDHNAYLWAAILFMTRVGAATVEIMTDTYFFKKVDASKANVISFFRTARPLAYVVSPIIATLLFTVFDMKGLFIFLGLLMLYGLRYSTVIADAR